MDGIRTPLIQYWHQSSVPPSIERLSGSFRAHNPEMRHMVFSEATATDFIEERFGAREAAAFLACAVPAMQADYLRYCAVYALGGMYFDADCRCVASLRPLFDACGGILVGIHEAGSLDGYFGDGGGPRWNPRIVRAVRESVGDFETVDRAFAGVCVSPRTKLDGFVVHDGSSLPYKRTADHVANFRGSIYR